MMKYKTWNIKQFAPISNGKLNAYVTSISSISTQVFGFTKYFCVVKIQSLPLNYLCLDSFNYVFNSMFATLYE